MTRAPLVLLALTGACSSHPPGHAPGLGVTPRATEPRVQPSEAEAQLEHPGASAIEAPTEPPSLYRALFERGRRFTYRVDYDVDPHTPDGRRTVTHLTIDCAVRDAQSLRGAVASVIECEGRGKDASERILPDSELGFVAGAAGLWSTTPLVLQVVVDGALGEPPLIEASPKSSRRSFTEPGIFAESGDHPCTEIIEVKAGVACSEVRCKTVNGYGPTVERQCFSKRGLESLHRENLGGPMVTTWTLIETTNPPPHS